MTSRLSPPNITLVMIGTGTSTVLEIRPSGWLTDDLTAARDCRPQISFGINRGAVGNTAEAFDRCEQALVGNRTSSEVVVVGRNRSGHNCPRSKTRAIVGTEARAVGTSDGGFQCGAFQRTVETIN